MARQREWLDILFVAAFATKLSTALDTYRGEKYLIKRREEAAKVIQRMTRKKFFRKKMAAQRSATNTIAKFVSMHYDQYRKRRMNRATDIVKDALKTVVENGKLKTVMYSFRNRVVKSQRHFKDLKLIHTAQRDLLVRQFQREEAAIIKEAVTQYKSTFARSQLHREEQLKHDRGRMYFGRVPYKGPQITRIPAPSLPASRTQRVPHDYLVFITNEWHHRERRKFGVQWTQYKQDLRRYNAQTSRRQAFVHFLAQAVQGKAEASENEAVPDTAQTRAETILDKVLEPNPAPRRPVFSRLIPKEELRALIMQAREDCNIPPLHFEPTY
uniref:Uncharacterized protein n=1 Tax=Palpitomonas bilix TaxID=652834 RepID=A0A7S3DLN7_9EUKA